jgi:hypothetical protein
MTQEERDKITAFVASMGFERSGDIRAAAEHIEQVIKAHRTAAAKREQKEAAEWAPGGWRREPTQ